MPYSNFTATLGTNCLKEIEVNAVICVTMSGEKKMKILKREKLK